MRIIQFHGDKGQFQSFIKDAGLVGDWGGVRVPRFYWGGHGYLKFYPKTGVIKFLGRASSAARLAKTLTTFARAERPKEFIFTIEASDSKADRSFAKKIWRRYMKRSRS